jgi:acyl-coenzyme A thioesterase PaaI-like protein
VPVGGGQDGPVSTEAFYVDDGPAHGGGRRYLATAHTNGPWGQGVQHGGPPSALLARALEQMPADDDRTVARVTVDLWGPVPVGPLTVTTRVERPGRSVELVSADLLVDGRRVARASAWRFPAQSTSARTPPADLPPPPEKGREQGRPPSWYGGYLDAVEWRWVHGAVLEPGPATVWMRPRIDLVHGEPISALQRLLTCADSASGASAALDPAEWMFMNTELSVHVVREVAGEWVCVDAETTLAGTSAGLASARLLDSEGFVGRSAQSLLVAPR